MLNDGDILIADRRDASAMSRIVAEMTACVLRHSASVSSRPKHDARPAISLHYFMQLEPFKTAVMTGVAGGSACEHQHQRSFAEFDVPFPPLARTEDDCRQARCSPRRNPTPRIPLPAQARRAGGVEEVAAAPSLHRRTVNACRSTRNPDHPLPDGGRADAHRSAGSRTRRSGSRRR